MGFPGADTWSFSTTKPKPFCLDFLVYFLSLFGEPEPNSAKHPESQAKLKTYPMASCYKLLLSGLGRSGCYPAP